MSTKTKSKPPAKAAGRFAGMKLAFAGQPQKYVAALKEVQAWAKEEGATVQPKVSADTDVLVVLERGASAGPVKQAEKFNQQGSSIVSITEGDFYERFMPTPDEIVQLFKAGKQGRQRIQELLKRSRPHQSGGTIDLRGADLRGVDLDETPLRSLNLEGADLREAKLHAVEGGSLTNVRLEKATGEHFRPNELHHCNCRGAKLPHMFLGWSSYGQNKAVDHCDFTGADLNNSYFSYSYVASSSFRQANLTESELHDANFKDVDFSSADLSNAKLNDVKCKGSTSFAGAKLVNIDGRNLAAAGVDFSKADLTGAVLVGADLSQAKFAGANFSGALLFGANLKDADLAKAKNLNLPPQTKAKAGQACQDIDAAGKASDRVTIEANVAVHEGNVFIQACGSRHPGHVTGLYRFRSAADAKVEQWFRAPSLIDALEQLAQIWGHGQLQFDTIKVSTQKGALKGKGLTDLATRALAEVFAATPPSDDELREKKKGQKAQKSNVAAELGELLRGGKAGVQQFNERMESMIFEGFRNEDFSSAKLSGMKAIAVGFQQCNFDQATMKKMEVRSSDFRKATFRGTDFQGSDLESALFNGCDFTGANLANTLLAEAIFDGANLSDADLTGADLGGTSLKRAQLASAKLDGVKRWVSNPFDEQTTFPADFTIPETFVYVGKGNDPRLAVTKAIAVDEVPDFDVFLERLKANIDADRLSKSLKMLKADRFQLFSEVTDASIVGVVKSQTDKDLVYSCRLTSQGEFCCCTQNLNVCGGLRGALCKHLLVLIIGITKAGSLAPHAAATWAHASSRRKPVLDKDAMSETLLRYKGAEAGEIDWRPTETVPEDYYAF